MPAPHGVQAAAPAGKERSGAERSGRRGSAQRRRARHGLGGGVWTRVWLGGVRRLEALPLSLRGSICSSPPALQSRPRDQAPVTARVTCPRGSGRRTLAHQVLGSLPANLSLSLSLFLIRVVTCLSLSLGQASDPLLARLDKRHVTANHQRPPSCSSLRTMHLPSRPLACTALESRDPFSSP